MKRAHELSLTHQCMLFLVLSPLFVLYACQNKEYIQNEGNIFGTTYHITYASSKDLQPGIEAELNKFDAALSMYNPHSTLSRINKAGSEKIDLRREPWTLKVIEESIKLSELTHGAFDITVAPLVNAWGFGFKKMSDISQQDIDSLKQFVGYRLLHLDKGILTKADPRIQLDASAVAKGYACDVIADFLRKKGIEDYLIEIGGEMSISGENPKGSEWRVGINEPIDDPTSTNMEWKQKLTLTDKAIATSGNYRKFYEKNGRRYAHTIDPATGYPVQHSLLSATVVAKDCLTADALATAFMVMGVNAALSLAEKLPDVEGLFIYNDGGKENKVCHTSGIPAFQK
ncbi:MAG: FAD:protein FMN transferase [Bacteroidales bacterium]|nr:FAD:protein FMN transferase [Bacteroidales bacterium]